jgi:hypothetical protein
VRSDVVTTTHSSERSTLSFIKILHSPLKFGSKGNTRE